VNKETPMKISIISLALACVAAALPFTARALENQGGASLVALTPGDIRWEPQPNRPTGFMQFPLWGPLDGFHARFIKWPAKAAIPLHKHTADHRMVVISGTYLYGVNQQPEKQYGPGSFIMTPGGTPHTAGCPEGCIFYEEVSGTADAIPVSK
jgi:quercetin dioxygenase-like cupin family protein